MADGKINVTLKAGPDYGEPWVTVSGESVEEVQATLGALASLNVYNDVISAAEFLKAARTVTVTGPVQATAAPTQVAPGVQQAQAPPAQANAPAANALFCPHGQRTKRSGNGANGRWTAHFCALAKGHPDACKPIWE